MYSVRKIATAAAVLAAAAGTAKAADLPARVAPAPYVAPLPVFTWTGAYFGINAGADFDNTTRFNLSPATTLDNGIGTNRPATFKNSDDGFTAGGQVGYNYEFGGFNAFGPGVGVVVGVEADAAYVDALKTGTYLGNVGSAGGTAVNNFRSGLDFLGTVRGRVGLAFNQFLIYGTGGFAYGDVIEKAALYTQGNPNQLRYYGSKGGFETGYVYGGGVEYALPTGSFLNFFHSSAVTLKLEYLRYDLDSTSFVARNILPTAGTGSAYDMRTKTEGNLARVGLNYKF